MQLHRHTWFQCAALVFLAAAVFWPGLGGDFLFDDYPNIVTNPKVHLESVDAEGLVRAAKGYEPGPFGRPIATLSFAFNHLVGGLEPWGYKATGLAVHLINALLVFVLVRRLLPSAGVDRDVAKTAAFAIALVWAIHPMQVSSVLYVVQRMETLAVTFLLGALLAYLAGREAQIAGRSAMLPFAGCAVLVVAALLCKETGALFPVFALALELAIFRFRMSSPAATTWFRRSWAIATALAIAAFLAFVLPRHLDPAVYEFRGFTLAERLLSQFRVLVMYVVQMLLPAPRLMTFYYDTYPVSRGLLSPASTLVCLLLLGAWLAFATWRRDRAPLFLLGTLWFFGSHVLTSNVFPLEIAFEHRNYFALLGVLLCVADLVFRLPRGEIPRLRPLTVGIVVAGLAVLTLLRSATWGDPTMLAMDLAAKNPESSRASVDLGEQFMQRANGDADSPYFARAVAEFERGAALPDSSPLPEQALILLASSADVRARDAWWESFLAKIETRPIGPQELQATGGLLQQRDKLRQFDDAAFRRVMDALIARHPLSPYLLATYGDYLIAHHDDAPAARAAYVDAARGSRSDPQFIVQLVTNLLSEGRPEFAKAALEAAEAEGVPLPEGFRLDFAPVPTEQ